MDENETFPIGLDTFVGFKDVEATPLPTIGDVGVTDTVSDFTIAPGLPPPSTTLLLTNFLASGVFDFLARAPPINLVAANIVPVISAIILYYRLI